MNGHLRWLTFFGIGSTYFGAVYWIYAAMGHGAPKMELWPLWVAPALTFSTATLTFLGMVKAYSGHQKVVVFNAWSMIVVALICFALSIPSSPEVHILVVIALFGYFYFWDTCMIAWLADDNRTRLSTREIEMASRLINKPTLVAFVILLALVLLHRSAAGEHLLGQLSQELFAIKDVRRALVRLVNCEAEVFVSGAIAFHLLTASVAYLLARELEEKAQTVEVAPGKLPPRKGQRPGGR